MMEWFFWLMFHPLGLLTYAGAMIVISVAGAIALAILAPGGDT